MKKAKWSAIFALIASAAMAVAFYRAGFADGRANGWYEATDEFTKPHKLLIIPKDGSPSCWCSLVPVDELTSRAAHSGVSQEKK
jgi:hypothetical protein